MKTKSVKLGRVEKAVMFCGFVLVTGSVIGLYSLVSSLHDDGPASVALAKPATRPATPKAAVIEPKPMALETPLRPPLEVNLPKPATRPVQVVVKAEPKPEPEKPVVALVAPPPNLLTAKPAPDVKPYVVPLISAQLVASAGDASDDQPYFYHLKIDPAEIELLRAMLTQAGKHDQLQPDEYDHLAAEPAGTSDLAWWQPTKLDDVSVLSLTPKTDPRTKLWSAISGKTGDVLVYSVKPIDFSRHAVARSSD
jgi:hypothetical protein